MRYFSLVMQLILLCLSVSISDAQTINGFVVGSPGCSVRVHRQTPWADDEVRTITDGQGYWEADCRDFYGPLNPGDRFYVDYGWNLGSPVTLSSRRGRDSIEHIPDVHLDQFTVCIKDIADSSHIAGDLKLYYQLVPRSAHNPKPVIVDTGQTEGAFFDVHLALPKYRVFPTSVLYFKLFKTFGPAQESVAYTERTDELCPSRNAQVLYGQLWFPEQRTARQRQNQPSRNALAAPGNANRCTTRSMLLAAQSRSHERPKGVLFNTVGQRVPDGKVSRLGNGTYFLVTQDPPAIMKYVITH